MFRRMGHILIQVSRGGGCLTGLLFLINIQLADLTTFLEGNPPGSVHTVDICHNEFFQPRCGSGYVIIIQNATYGRMALGRCVNIDMGYLGCKLDATAIAEQRCSGKNSCEISNSEFTQLEPCLELQSFLRVSYFCLKVLTSIENSCSESHFLKTTQESGYISSQRTDCPNTSNNIWLIEAKPGQRINLTLIDFGVKSRVTSPQGDFFSDLDMCQKYADVRDSATGKEFVACGKRRRQQHILESLGNAVEIDFSGRNSFSGENKNEFLIYFNAVGCPTPPLASNTWSKSQGQKLLIGCRDSGSPYEITCQGATWLGSYKNCSTDDISLGASYQEDNFMFSTLPKGLVIAAIVAIAVVVGTVIVVVGIIVFKRRRTLDYMDGAYTIPNSEKVYVSPPDSRHHVDFNPGGMIQQQKSNNKAYHMTHGYNKKYQGYPSPSDGMDTATRTTTTTQPQKSALEPDYHCVVDSSVTGQQQVPTTDIRGYLHVWDRPLPAPESQHSC